MVEDYGKSKFREIGQLSSMLPAYVRHCCRSIHDGTDILVLDAFRTEAYKTLVRFQDKYGFIPGHMELLRIYDPEKIQEIIKTTRIKDRKIAFEGCLSTGTVLGLPKRACLHCPKVGEWIQRMKEGGTIDETTGKRRE